VLGGALATVLVGPWVGALCVSVVLMVQALLFADGGLTALGSNICLMAFVTVAAAQLVLTIARRVLPPTKASVVGAAFVAALVSVPTAALVFSILFAVGGTTEVPVDTLVTAMVGVHLVIGFGEAVIAALTVSSVLAVRPDLVRAARHLLPTADCLATVSGPATGGRS